MMLVADTHAALWYLWAPPLLSSIATEAMDEAVDSGQRIGLSSISLCEVVYLVERKRIRDDAFEILVEATQAADAPFEEIPLTIDVCTAMADTRCATIRDMPDRIIAATAVSRTVPLVTKDRAIRESEVTTIW